MQQPLHRRIGKPCSVCNLRVRNMAPVRIDALAQRFITCDSAR